MSQPNAWHTAGRGPRNPSSASRTPQNRSGNASPIAQLPLLPSKPESNRAPPPVPNVWAQRGGNSNGPMKPDNIKQDIVPLIGEFNAAEIKAFLGRESSPRVYKPAGGGGNTRTSGGAQKGTMANGQSFFLELAKQIAKMEGGG